MSKRYTVRHVTRFAYETAISESVMEVRMQPRSEGPQRCLQFGLTTNPPARVIVYMDHDGNTIHHFDIPGRHSRLTLITEALVDCDAPPPLPYRLGPAAWTQLDAMTVSGEFWDWLAPSTFVQETAQLRAFANEIGIERGNDPLVALRRAMAEMYKRFEYAPKSTRVDSPIDDALVSRRGVCQDFAHIFIALARALGVPARYVSGYIFHDDHDRAADNATHAWVETLLPDVGWVGFDPTNNLIAEERHVRVAIGRDYADVPPTRGVFKGVTKVRSELAVAVKVGAAKPGLSHEVVPFSPWMSRDPTTVIPDQDAAEQNQQQ